MNLLLTDRPVRPSLDGCADSHLIDLSGCKIAACNGCFACWTRTPGRCVIRDDAVKIYPLIAQCDRLLLVSRIRFGCYDLPVKRMLERSLPIQQPFLQLRQGETHHALRDVHPKDAVLIAYGESSAGEQELFRRLVERNARNLCFQNSRILFVREENLDDTVAKEAARWEE